MKFTTESLIMTGLVGMLLMLFGLSTLAKVLQKNHMSGNQLKLEKKYPDKKYKLIIRVGNENRVYYCEKTYPLAAGPCINRDTDEKVDAISYGSNFVEAFERNLEK